MAEIDWEADSVIADGDKELSRGPCKVRLYKKKKIDPSLLSFCGGRGVFFF